MPARKGQRGRTERKAKAKAKAKTDSRRSKPSAARSAKAGAHPKVRAFRLDPRVVPRALDFHLEIDPATSDRFRGEVRYELEIPARRRTLRLHAIDLRISRPRLVGGGRTLKGRIQMHPEIECVDVLFDEPLPSGRIQLELTFSGKLRSDLRGLYLAKSGKHRFAFSQMAPASARRVLPCFDEPGIKIPTRVSVTTGSDQRVLANTPLSKRERVDGDRSCFHFEPTPPLSSYLLAVAVGPFECSPAVFAGSTEIRVWHAPGKDGMSEFALECARESLLRLESWFDLPYPYAKLDLIAAPDFEFGAMENPGAVVFREALLLLDPATATLAEKKRVAEVICHELSHMWYGNLVTMAWWDDLWLNEAFATWMAFEIIDRWRPDWHMWSCFLQNRSAALELDGLQNTHPIYTPVRTPDDANANFDVITYEKGAAVIRMIERYLGAEIFCAGVRKYIRDHHHSTAVGADLWHALSEVSGEELEPIVRAWIEQPGHPVVQIRRIEHEGAATLELRQERFLERSPGSRKAGSKPERWPIPWVGRVGNGSGGKTHLARHLLRKTRERIPATGADLTFVYGNANEGGFWRPQHDAGDTVDLIEDFALLHPLERLGFVDHQWALVRAGRAPVASLLDLLAVAGIERDPDVLNAVRRPLATMARRLAPDLGPDIEDRLRAWIEVYYGAQVDDLGWTPREGEDARSLQRRAIILDIVGVVGRASTLLDEARERCEKWLHEPDSLAVDLQDPTLAMAACTGDASLYESLLAARDRMGTPQQQRRLLLGLADFRDPALIDRTLAWCISGEVPTGDVAHLLARLLHNRSARDRTWSFITRRFTRLSRQLGTLSFSRIVEATPALSTREARREVAAFFREHPVPGCERKLRQALERFDWYDEYRRRAGPELVGYLTGSDSSG